MTQLWLNGRCNTEQNVITKLSCLKLPKNFVIPYSMNRTATKAIIVTSFETCFYHNEIKVNSWDRLHKCATHLGYDSTSISNQRALTVGGNNSFSKYNATVKVQKAFCFGLVNHYPKWSNDIPKAWHYFQ